MEDSFEEDLLPSGEFQDELLQFDHSTNLINKNNKKRPLFQPTEEDKEEEDSTSVELDDEELSEESLNSTITKKQIKNYTGQEDYTNEKYYQPTGFGQGGLFMANKRRKLQVQHNALLEDEDENGLKIDRPQIFKGLKLYINGLTDNIGLRQLTELIVQYGGVRIG